MDNPKSVIACIATIDKHGYVRLFDEINPNTKFVICVQYSMDSKSINAIIHDYESDEPFVEIDGEIYNKNSREFLITSKLVNDYDGDLMRHLNAASPRDISQSSIHDLLAEMDMEFLRSVSLLQNRPLEPLSFIPSYQVSCLSPYYSQKRYRPISHKGKQ